MTRTEYERIREFLGGCEPFPIVRKTGQMIAPCPFKDPRASSCVIYPVRPLICRLFGIVECLPCPIGRVPVLVADGAEIMREYSQFELHAYRQWQPLHPKPEGV